MKFWKFAILAAVIALPLPAAERLLRLASVPETKVVNRVYPEYPADALYLKVQGVVKVNIVIGSNGHVESAHVVSGHPLLSPAALDAAKRWVYQPTLVDDVPVRVATQVTIPFGLDREGKPLPHPTGLLGDRPEFK